MKIRVSHSAADAYAGEIVRTALVRSFTAAQVSDGNLEPFQAAGCQVWINPTPEVCHDLETLLASGGKAIVLGRVGPQVAAALGLELRGTLEVLADWADCPLDPRRHHDESRGTVGYTDEHELARQSPLQIRPWCRFDFANEWNNLGFGRITLDGSAWSLQSAIECGAATPLALLASSDDHGSLVYAALRETEQGAVLWINRPVGPVDSLEWRVVESFLGDYRADDLVCLPYLAEIPAGYRGAVCARLDCDEAVSTARPLWELYRDHGLPLSLALLTGQSLSGEDLRLMRDLLAERGSVVSHSVHHEPNWGGSYERACDEARQSRAWFDEHLPEAMPARYAVSPFHQNPPYAVSALADCGYEGFVGGIIANDPEYLLGRAGRVPFVSKPMVSLSAQCMLHGDCYRRYGNSIDVYRQSFDEHLAGAAIFGYLDHPFSSRYQYGWDNETTRIAAHRQLIEHIEGQSDIWWASLDQMLRFLCQRDKTLLAVDGGRWAIDAPADREWPLTIHWKGRQVGH